MLKLINNLRNFISKGAAFLIWFISALIAYDFFIHGARKLDPSGWWAPAFEKWGYPTWFMILIGIIELIGALLLIIPKVRYIGAFFLFIIMLGALTTKALHKIAIEEVVFFLNILTLLLFLFIYEFKKQSNQ
ncbi:MAG: DoxX family protein [Flavobacteriaceae bacterium]